MDLDSTDYTIYYILFAALLLFTIVYYLREKRREYETMKQREGFNLFRFLKSIIMLIPMTAEIMSHVGEIFENMINALSRFPDFIDGLGIFASGAFEEVFVGLPQLFLKVLPDFLVWFIATLFYGFEHIQCGLALMNNFPQCFFWYALEIFGILLYLPIRFIVWLLSMQYVENEIWNGIYKLDKQFYLATGGRKDPNTCSGYHFAHYPCFVINMCYRCVINGERKLTQAEHDKYAEKGEPLYDDLQPGSAVYNAVVNPFFNMLDGMSKMISVFS